MDVGRTSRKWLVVAARSRVRNSERFGEDLTYINNNDNPAIDKDILKHFKRLHGGKAQWYKSPDGYWRLEDTK